MIYRKNSLTALIVTLTLLGCKSDETARSPRPEAAKASPTSNNAGKNAATKRLVVDDPAAKQLVVDDLSFAGPAGHRKEALFSRGETVLCLFTLAGYQQEDKKVELVGALEVHDQQGRLVFRKAGLALAQGAALSEKPGRLRAMAKVALHRATPPGRYTLNLSVHDKLAHRKSQAKGVFEVLGTAYQKAEQLSLRNLTAAADSRLPAGSFFPLRFEVSGFATAPLGETRTGPAMAITTKLSLVAELHDKEGKVIKKERRKLRGGSLPHGQLDLPFETQFALPAGLAAGKYMLSLKINDELGKTSTRGKIPVQVIAKSFGIYNIHLHDAGRLPRESYRLGEKASLRFSVQGFATRKGAAELSVDLAVAGPNGGVYLMRKKAASLSGPKSKPFAVAGRFPMELPLTLPALAPTGRYRIVLRAKDHLNQGMEVVAERVFRITGKAPRPLARFAIDQLQVRRRADLPEIKGDTFRVGRSYSLTVHAGAATKEVAKMTYEADLLGKVQLRRLGKLLHTQEGVFKIKRRFNYRPLRIQLTGRWTIPAMLRPGLYDMELVLENRLEERISQLVRRIEIVRIPK
jgi:hypothetical protein